MKNRYWVAVALLFTVGILLTIEIIYLKSSSEFLADKLEKSLENLQNGDNAGAEKMFGEFIEEYKKKESVVSLFTHDSNIENINSLIDEIKGLLKTENTEEIGGAIQNLLGKIKDLYSSVVPNMINVW